MNENTYYIFVGYTAGVFSVLKLLIIIYFIKNIQDISKAFKRIWITLMKSPYYFWKEYNKFKEERKWVKKRKLKII